MNKKTLKIFGYLAVMILIIVFVDYALDGFLTGWNNPK